MNWKDVGAAVVGKVPLIGGLLGGQVGSQVGNLIAGALGVGKDPQSVMDALEGNPEAIVTLRQYELNHEVELKRLQLNELSAVLADRSNARDREIHYIQSMGRTDGTMKALAWTICLGFMGIVGLLCFHKPSTSEPLMILFGALASGFGGIVNYYFGSSRGSREKDLASGNQKTS